MGMTFDQAVRSPAGAPAGPSGGAPAPVERDRLVPPTVRRLGLAWLAVSLPFTTAVAAFATSPGAYVFVLVFMACGAYTAPALVAAGHAVRHAAPRDRASYALLLGGLATVVAIGVGMLVGLATGWRWGNVLGAPSVVVAGLAHMAGIAALARSRSGRRELVVDIVEAVAAVVAVVAPMVVLWGPSVVDAEASWFTVPAALAVVPMAWGVYWTALLYVRTGPGRGPFVGGTVVLAVLGLANGVLQTAQGVSGFTLAAPPLVALTAVVASMYLLVPLHAPRLLAPGLDRLPPQAQVRGGWLPAAMTSAGAAALLAATAGVAGERPWAVPFALGTVTLLLGLAGVRQGAGAWETRRLYRQVEDASAERRELIHRLLERAVHDRRLVAGHLHEQALAAYASFAALAGPERAAGAAGMRADASALVRADLARHADTLHELVVALRPLAGGAGGDERLRTPIAAYLASVYGERTTPRLSVAVRGPVALDWVAETVVLQVVQEALHNVWRHSQARTVDVVAEATDAGVVVRVTDDGVGFTPGAVPAGTGPGEAGRPGTGLDAMRAVAAVVGGTCEVASRPGGPTTVTLSLPPTPRDQPPPPPTIPALRLVPPTA